MLKVSIAYFYGYKAVGTLVYSWPEAYDKARAADRVLRQRLADLGLEFEQILTEFVGVDATHGTTQRDSPTPMRPRCSFASACGRGRRRRSSDSPASSRRWC